MLEQRYPNLEYIIMDGGSTDGSVDIIEKYEQHLAYWESQKDLGQSHAINKGWKRCTGEIFAWLNSDDLYTPGALFEVAEVWKKDPRVGFISGITERVDENGKSKGKYFGTEFDLIQTLTTSTNTTAQQSTFINRKALEEAGYLDENLHMSMDWDLWLRIGARYPVKFVPSIWSQIREWDETKTASRLIDSGEEHVAIVKNFFRNEFITLTPKIKHTALAAAYGRKAFLLYQSGHYQRYQIDALRSIFLDPSIKGGDSRSIINSKKDMLRIIQSTAFYCNRLLCHFRN